LRDAVTQMTWFLRIVCAGAILQSWACTGPQASGVPDSGIFTPGGSGGATGSPDASSFSTGGAEAKPEATGGSSEVGDGPNDEPPAPAKDAGLEVGAVAGQLVCDTGRLGNGQSRLTTGDPPEWGLKAGVVPGKLTPRASFLSNAFGKHFPFVIYTSANYVMGQPATLLVFGDGGQYLSDFHAQTVLDNLTAAGDMPPTVGLFIDPPSDGDRVQTYDPPLDKYPTLLASEIIPSVIIGKYSVSSDPNAWVVVGYSASGGQGWNVIWKKPDRFHKFIGHSASVGAANVAMYGNVNWVDIVKMSPKHDLRVSLTTCDRDLTDTRGNWKTILTNLFTALTDKGNDARLVVGPSGHYPPIDGERDFPNSLRWMFQGCKFAK
jgi:enterochelin esterase family protein